MVFGCAFLEREVFPAHVFISFLFFCRFHAGGTNANRPDLKDIQPGENNMDTPCWALKASKWRALALLSLFLIAMLLNYMVSMHRLVLGFTVLPTMLLWAILRPAARTLTAVASPLPVVW